MPELKPFKGIRYPERDLDELACPPYDVISPQEQEKLYHRHEHNAVRLELAQTGGDTGRYSEVGELFRRWLADGTLVADEVDAVYAYRQDFVDDRGRARRVAGVIGALTLEEFGDGVLPHERTMPGPKEDRLALMRACPVNISPIFGIFRGGGAARSLLDELDARPPAGTLTDDSEVTHRVWVVTEPGEIETLTRPVTTTPLVIADGHHRYETALAFQAERDGAPGRHDAMMCFCVDADAEDLFVLAYHRIISAAVSTGDLRDHLETKLGATEVRVEEATAALASSRADHAFAFLLEGRCLLAEVDDAYVEARAQGPRAWRDLDVVALHEAVLPEIVPQGVTDIVFTKDAEQVRADVWAGGDTFGVLLRAVQPVEVVDVATSGARMPQKASHFWPKAVSGLVFRSLE